MKEINALLPISNTFFQFLEAVSNHSIYAYHCSILAIAFLSFIETLLFA